MNSLSARFDPRDVSEAQALLAWMDDRHFTFLGYKEYRLRSRKGHDTLEAVEATGLGILRRGHKRPPNTSRSLSADIRRQSRSRDLVLVTKANLQSTVHRAGYLDYVGVKHFDAKGRLIGERRFLGLWTSAAYNCAIRARFRWCATRSRRWCCTSPWRPTATTARRCSTYWSRFRATSCSRRTCRN